MSLFVKLQQQGRTILIVTNDTHIAAYSQRTINLFDGRIIQAAKENPRLIRLTIVDRHSIV